MEDGGKSDNNRNSNGGGNERGEELKREEERTSLSSLWRQADWNSFIRTGCRR
jgi:hypothetical protein